MFGFRKKEKKALMIKMNDVIYIMKSDYEDGQNFMIDFKLNDNIHRIGTAYYPDSKQMKKENLYFEFEGKHFKTYEEFASGALLDGIKLLDSKLIVEVIAAGIFDGEPMLKTPWGDTRLEKYSIVD